MLIRWQYARRTLAVTLLAVLGVAGEKDCWAQARDHVFFNTATIDAVNQCALVSSADFDRDSRPDFVVMENAGGAWVARVYHNSGGGVFTPLSAIGLPAEVGSTPPLTLAAIDVNNDGAADVVVVGNSISIDPGPPSSECSTVWVAAALNDGLGQFSPMTYSSASLGCSSQFSGESRAFSAAIVADFNNNGQAAVVVAIHFSFTDPNAGPRGLYLYTMQNVGAGHFSGAGYSFVEPFDPLHPSDTLMTLNGLAAADFDGDGFLDIAIEGTKLAERQEAVLALRRTGSAPLFAAVPGTAFGAISLVPGVTGYGLPGLISAADYDGDSHPDIVVAVGQGSTDLPPPAHPPCGISLIRNAGTDSGGWLGFAGVTSYTNPPLSPTQNFPFMHCISADLNGDGKAELIGLGVDQSWVFQWIGVNPSPTQSEIGGGGLAWAAAADFSGDGCKDIVVVADVNNTSQFIYVLTRRAIADFNGDGVITPADVSRFVAAWSNPSDPDYERTDWNKDGAHNPDDVAQFVSDWFAALNGGNCATP